MEDIRKIKLQSNTNLKANSLAKTNKKVKSYKILKQKIIKLNTCISIGLIILLSVGYTDMVGISSNNLLLESENQELMTELSSIKEIAENSNSDERIKKIAMSRLDMIFPTQKNIVELDKESEEVQVGLINDKNESNKSIFSTITDLFR